MKRNLFFTISIMLLAVIAASAQASSKKVTITVLELKSMKAIENATVSMVMNRVSNVDQIRQRVKPTQTGGAFLPSKQGRNWHGLSQRKKMVISNVLTRI